LYSRLQKQTAMYIFPYANCRFLRKILPRSRTMEFGCDIRAEPVITTCTRNTEILLWTVLLNKCTTKWHLVIEWGVHASRLLRLPPFQPNFAKGRAPSNSSTPKSSSLWCSRRLGPQLGSSKQRTRHPSRTCSCNSQSVTFSTFHLEAAWFIRNIREHREGNHIATTSFPATTDCLCSYFWIFFLSPCFAHLHESDQDWFKSSVSILLWMLVFHFLFNFSLLVTEEYFRTYDEQITREKFHSNHKELRLFSNNNAYFFPLIIK